MADEWITIATFFDSVEANLAKTKLESEEIEALLQDEHVSSLYGSGPAPAGIRLQVPADQAQRAKKILRV